MRQVLKTMIVLPSLLSVAQAQNRGAYQPYMNAPQAPQAPGVRQAVTTPDGRVVQIGGGQQPSQQNFMQPQQRMQSSFETTRFPARMVYLNGQNISATKDQILENVTVKIDEFGNIHITAPHYEIATDSSYHPLLPSELPRFPKDRIQIDGLPQGNTYSKDPQSVQATPRLPSPPSKLGSSRPSPEDNPPPITPPSDPGLTPQKTADASAASTPATNGANASPTEASATQGNGGNNAASLPSSQAQPR